MIYIAVFLNTSASFQFLGIPPKGERAYGEDSVSSDKLFPISRDPPEGGTLIGKPYKEVADYPFPISRDPPEGGTNQTTE